MAPDPDYLSAFTLDVDTASYGYARRTLSEGRLPDPSTVRPEEFVNSFRQDYERPDGNGFTVTVDGARTDAAGAPDDVVLRRERHGGRHPVAAVAFAQEVKRQAAQAAYAQEIEKLHL
ncbi:von Willebrand factor type A domain-containing protein [Streptomyces chlorus]|uniref:von Willebrand factor type A domain-containing protein n=1 Tax=Streptomyces chlorus TaxID=887452 RepID=A0ABW1E8C0_9ACTN